MHEVIIDGLSVYDASGSVINDRQKLGEDGVLTLGISVDSREKVIIGGPDIQMRGVIFLKDADDFLAELVATFEKLVIEALENKTINEPDTRVKIKDRLVGLVRRFTGKDPLILPIIMDISQK